MGLVREAASMIIAQESFETSEPTIDSHIVKLKSLNADVLVNFGTPKFAAQSIKKMGEIAGSHYTCSPMCRLRLKRHRRRASKTAKTSSRLLS